MFLEGLGLHDDVVIIHGIGLVLAVRYAIAWSTTWFTVKTIFMKSGRYYYLFEYSLVIVTIK